MIFHWILESRWVNGITGKQLPLLIQGFRHLTNGERLLLRGLHYPNRRCFHSELIVIQNMFKRVWILARQCYPALEVVAVKCELSLVPARVLSIASRAKANSLHTLWPIRTPRPTCANQDA